MNVSFKTSFIKDFRKLPAEINEKPVALGDWFFISYCKLYD